MLPDLTILLALILGLGALVEGSAEPLTSVAGTLASACVVVALAWMGGERALRAVRAGAYEVAQQEAARVSLWPLLGWIAALLFFDWGTFVANEVPRTLWLGRYVVLFLPAGAMWAAAWAAQGRVEAAAAERRGLLVPETSSRRAILQGLKRNGLALLPLGLLLALLDGLWLLGEWGVPGLATASRWIEALPLLSVGVMLVVLSLLTLLLPRILRWVLSTEPLPAGQVRERLEEFARAMGLRYREIVLWHTKGRVLNAMVVGYTPGTRVIFLTDALLRHLPEDEVLAVFAHETGHAKRWHLPLFLVLFSTTALLFQVVGDVLMAHGLDPTLILVAHLAFLWFVLLGSVSRHFEREADVFGAEHAADLDVHAQPLYLPGLPAPLPAGAARMMQALERVRQVTGREKSHRHGTIQQRVEFLAGWGTRPAVREAFARRRRQLLLLTALVTVAAAIATALRLPVDVDRARARLAFNDGVEAYQRALERRRAGEDEDEAGWRRAYEAFVGAARRVESQTEPDAEDIRIRSLFNAADTALRGLRDKGAARAGWERALAEIEASDLPPEATRQLAFAAAVDLGRLQAQAGDAASAGRSLTLALARRWAQEGDDGAYVRARLALLRAAVAAAEGRAEEARALLQDHVLRVGTGDEDRWWELRTDAREDLSRLSPTPGPEAPQPEAAQGPGDGG